MRGKAESRPAVFTSGAWKAPAIAGSVDSFSVIGTDVASGRIAIAYMRWSSVGMDIELVESPGPSAKWSAPRRLSAQSMPLAWMPNTSSGRMLGDYISVHYAGGRPLVVWVLANQPVETSFRQAVYATRG